MEPYTIVDDPAAWYAEQYRDPESYSYRLSSEEISEVEAAIEHAESLGIREEVVVPSPPPWPSFSLLFVCHAPLLTPLSSLTPFSPL